MATTASGRQSSHYLQFDSLISVYITLPILLAACPVFVLTSETVRSPQDSTAENDNFLFAHQPNFKMTLSDNDKKALESSWKKLAAGGKQEAGFKLVFWMFENIPNMRDQFSKFNANQPDAALKGDAEFVKQVNVIVAALEGLISSVNNAGQLQANLDKLAKSHVNLKIGLEFFGPLQQNIAKFIDSALGGGAGSDEAKAWSNLIAAFNDTLKKA
ncbi:hypothetical protein Btru_037079 [Bulinus truncatus]|nr:hypothetical protein Btru_037079 [Bulinus truncatus]